MTDARDGPLAIRKHKCQHCPKSFKRREHWQRHSRSHTNEKPFECRFCQKCFARRDLVTRHEKTLHASAASPDGSPASVRKTSMAAARNGLSPTGVRSGAQTVVSPNTDERWDDLRSLATAEPQTQQSLNANDVSDCHAPSVVGGSEDFLDPALRMHSDGGGLWHWTADQTPQTANAYAVSQASAASTAFITSAVTLGNADKTSNAAIPDA